MPRSGRFTECDETCFEISVPRMINVTAQLDDFSG